LVRGQTPALKIEKPATLDACFQRLLLGAAEQRYFEPVRALENMSEKAGEGFAIVTLHCSLIEFLASTLAGKSYRYRRKGDPPLGVHEYSDSGNMFVDFLEANEPFKTMFAGAGTAREFYSSVRCGLLHEARTKGRWRIQVDPSAKQAIDTSVPSIYRNRLQPAFNDFVESYGRQLATDRSLQEAFIRKFDSLCKG
jgi:hypothetical protein